MRPLDRKDVKRINRSNIFQYIRASKEPAVSCTQISQGTKISLPTVLKSVDYFASRGCLRVIDSIESVSPTAGRKPTFLEFVPNAFCAIGIAFEGKYLECVCTNLNYEVLCSRSVRVQCDVSTLILEVIPQQLEIFITENKIDTQTLLSIGLALPASIDTKHYVTAASAPLIDLECGVSLKSECEALSKRFHCPVIIENDVNAAALGEFRERSFTGADDLVYVTLGTGLGSGMILKGKVRQGAHFTAGEIVNLSFSENFSVSAEHRDTIEFQLLPERFLRLFNYDAFLGAEAHDEETRVRVSNYIAHNLARVIINIQAVLDVEHFVLGGFVARQLGDYIIRFIYGYLHATPYSALDIQISTCAYASARGVSALACDKALDRVLMEDITE